MVVCHPFLQTDGKGPHPHLLRRFLRHTNIAHPNAITGVLRKIPRKKIRSHGQTMARIGGTHTFTFASEHQAVLPADFFYFPKRYGMPFVKQFFMEPFGPIRATSFLVGGFDNSDHML